jgi:hypothetical protein
MGRSFRTLGPTDKRKTKSDVGNGRNQNKGRNVVNDRNQNNGRAVVGRDKSFEKRKRERDEEKRRDKEKREREAEARKKKADLKQHPEKIPFTSRSVIKAVSINLNGHSVMGYTPKHKLLQIEDFLKVFPDIVFIQDSCEVVDVTPILEKVSDGDYDYHFSLQNDEERGGEWQGEVDRSITGMAWNRKKYFGTPLQFEESGLREYIEWLRRHDVTVVKLESKTRAGGWMDEYPSFIGIAWHGPEYEISLRDRMKTCEELYAFVDILRAKNCHIPIIIGGDFNMDMKSYENEAYPDLSALPYRPSSGKTMKDLKNTVVYTLDTLQITEWSYKQAHPEVFSCPFLTVCVRGKSKTHIWAIVRIQRMVRRYLKRNKDRNKNRKKMDDSKMRWKKKINGEDFDDDRRRGRSESRDRRKERNESKDRRKIRSESPRRRSGSIRRSSSRESSGGKREVKRKDNTGPKKDPKYALYWDPKDDPNYEEKGLTDEERKWQSRRTLDDGSGRNVLDAVWDDGEGGKRDREMPGGSPYRRKKFDDLKSMQQRKQEQKEAATAFDYGWD